MSYELIFLPRALRAWKKLDAFTRGQFKKKLDERLENPRIPKEALHFKSGHYKIKLAAKGYRLIHTVDDQRVTVIVIDVGRRDEIYDEI